MLQANKKLKITKTLWIQLCESRSERFCFKPQFYWFEGNFTLHLSEETL